MNAVTWGVIVYGTDVGLDQVDLAEILMVAIYTYL